MKKEKVKVRVKAKEVAVAATEVRMDQYFGKEYKKGEKVVTQRMLEKGGEDEVLQNILKNTVTHLLGNKYKQKRYTFFTKQSKKANSTLFFNQHVIKINTKIGGTAVDYKCDIDKNQFFLNDQEKGADLIPEIVQTLNTLMTQVNSGRQLVKLEKK